MTKMELTENAIYDNLIDAGCSQQTAKQFINGLKNGKTADSLKLLTAHRRTLLDSLHDAQCKIDCLDYLLYMIKKEKTNLEKRR